MADQPNPAPSPKSASSSGLSFAAALVPLLALIVAWDVRLRFASMPLERDEAEYACMGQLMLQGIPPYTEAFGMKFPGIYAAYAGMMAIFGHSESGIRVGLLVVNIATSLVMILLMQSLLRSDDSRDGARGSFVALAAAAAFAVMTVAPAMLGMTANTEHFVMLPAMVGLLLLYDAASAKRFLAAGICLGLAITVKQPGLMFAGFGLLWVILGGRAGVGKGRGLPRNVFCYLAGVALPLLAMVLGMWCAGAFEGFWFWTIRYASYYGGMWTWRDGIAHFSSQFMPILKDHALLIMIAIGGLIAALRAPGRQFWFAIGLLLAGFAATAPGFIFRSHYFLFIVPGLAASLALGLDAIQRRFHQTATMVVASLALALPLLLQAGTLLFADTETASRRLYPHNAFVETRCAGLWLRDHAAEGDLVGVLGSEPEISFYSGHRLATPYLYLYPLLETHPYANQMQEDFIGRMERSLPRWIVHARFPTSWLVNQRSNPMVLIWLTSFVRERYDLVNVIPMKGGPSGWDVVIYRRKEAAETSKKPSAPSRR
jgi:hypothetical protein